MAKKYTVKEIEDLRDVIERKYMFGTYSLAYSPRMSICFKESEKTIHVEENLRTHMLAGHTANDLIKSEKDTM